MPHGSRRIGQVEVVALCDGVVLASEPFEESFPGVQAETVATARERYPDTFAGERWRLHVHAFLVRSAGRTVLLDTGVGPESAPAFPWSGIRGALPEEIAAAGVAPADVDEVLITHLHDDHLGWNVAEGNTEPMFPNARYVLHRADWDLYLAEGDDEDLAIFDAAVRPLETAGQLELVTGDSFPVTDELTFVHAPGHTPGHQVLLIDSGDGRAILTGDTVNHPAQLLQPGLPGSSDFWPEIAAATRAEWLERIEREGRLVSTSHFPEPFGRFDREGDHRIWVPETD